MKNSEEVLIDRIIKYMTEKVTDNKNYSSIDWRWKWTATWSMARTFNMETPKLKRVLEKMLKTGKIMVNRSPNNCLWSMSEIEGYKHLGSPKGDYFVADALLAALSTEKG